VNIQLQPEFDDILQSLGSSAAEFFWRQAYTMLNKLALLVLLTWLAWILKDLKPA